MRKSVNFAVIIVFLLFIKECHTDVIQGGYIPDGSQWIWSQGGYKPVNNGYGDDGYAWNHPEIDDKDDPKKPKPPKEEGSKVEPGDGAGDAGEKERDSGTGTGYGADEPGKEEGKGDIVDINATTIAESDSEENQTQTTRDGDGESQTQEQSGAEPEWNTSEREQAFSGSGRDNLSNEWDGE